MCLRSPLRRRFEDSGISAISSAVTSRSTAPLYCFSRKCLAYELKPNSARCSAVVGTSHVRICRATMQPSPSHLTTSPVRLEQAPQNTRSVSTDSPLCSPSDDTVKISCVSEAGLAVALPVFEPFERFGVGVFGVFGVFGVASDAAPGLCLFRRARLLAVLGVEGDACFLKSKEVSALVACSIRIVSSTFLYAFPMLHRASSGSRRRHVRSTYTSVIGLIKNPPSLAFDRT